MIEVNIKIYPDGEKIRARIDPTVSIERTKSDLVRALGIGEPNEFEIAVIPKLPRTTLMSLRINTDDTILLMRKEDMQDSTVQIVRH